MIQSEYFSGPVRLDLSAQWRLCRNEKQSHGCQTARSEASRIFSPDEDEIPRLWSHQDDIATRSPTTGKPSHRKHGQVPLTSRFLSAIVRLTTQVNERKLPSAKLKLLLSRLGLLCLTYSFSRALFLAFNYQTYEQISLREILLSFGVGLRFDVAAICRINSPFIVLSMLPFAFVGKAGYQRFLKVVFLLTNVPFLILNVVDYEYLKFIGQRSTLNLLDMGADIPNQIGQLSYHYWYLAAISILFILALYIFFRDGRPSRSASSEGVKTADWFRDVVTLIVVVTLAVIGGRGGWQHRRLTTALAEVSDRESLSHLALNSTYTLINSQSKCDATSIAPLHYFATDDALKRQMPRMRSPIAPAASGSTTSSSSSSRAFPPSTQGSEIPITDTRRFWIHWRKRAFISKTVLPTAADRSTRHPRSWLDCLI